MNFHHLGVATRSISESSTIYTNLGYSPESGKITDEVLGISCQFFIHPTGPRIELVEALNDSNVLDPWLRSGSPIYHMAFELTGDDITFNLKESVRVTKEIPAVAFDMRPVTFYLQKGRQLIEIIGD